MAQARWAKDRMERDVGQAERMEEMRERKILNLPHKQGDVLGVMQWTCARSGKVRRWVIRMGDRVDRVTVESPGGARSGGHGWAWFLAKLRGHLVGAG